MLLLCGVAYVVASRRCGSLRDFESAAKVCFDVENWGSEYDLLTTSLLGSKKCFPEVLSLRHGVQVRRQR